MATLVITGVIVALAIFFFIYGLYDFAVMAYFFLVVAILVSLMCLATVVSGVFVLFNLSKSNSSSDRKGRMRSMAIQLILLSLGVFGAVAVLVILAFLPTTVFSSFWLYYGLEVLFPVLVQVCAQVDFVLSSN